MPENGQNVFIHVPKTAGIAIGRHLRHYGVDIRIGMHAPASSHVGAAWMCAFVRDPYDRLISAWRHLAYNKMNAADCAYARRHVDPFQTFGEYVRHLWADPEALRYWHPTPMVKFLDVPVDFIGRFENLQEDTQRLLSQLGVPDAGRMPSANDSGRSDYPKDIPRYYTEPDVGEIVQNLYAEDFERFGYSPEPPR